MRLNFLSADLAGDPLQTINPTGFRWSVIGPRIYRIDHKPIQPHELEENWRSDRRIVDFANRIQRLRASYLKEEKKFKPQIAYEREDEGDIPHVVVETDDEIKIVKDKLVSLPSHSAVILWDEEDENILQLLQQDRLLSQLPLNPSRQKLDERMSDYNLYKVSEMKGLERRCVILYKLGAHQDVKQWWNRMHPAQQPDQQDQIRLLFFLNRLYISITRAQSYLFIIDTPDAVNNFWAKWWPDVLKLVPRAELGDIFANHAAFSLKTSSDWEGDGDRRFDRAEDQQDIRDYERARSFYEKAKATQKAKRAEARIAELRAKLREEWDYAGNLYFEIMEFKQAAYCFRKSENWGRAIEAYERLPPDVERNRFLALCRCQKGCSEPHQKREAALDFLKHVRSDSGMEKEWLRKLADTLVEVKADQEAAELFVRLHRDHQDTHAGIEAGRCWLRLKQYDTALDIFRQCHYSGHEFWIGLQEQAEWRERQGEEIKAASSYGELGGWRKVFYIKQGHCLYRLKEYHEALEAFKRGEYQGKEYDVCKAEIALRREEFLEAIELFSKHGEYQRVLFASQLASRSQKARNNHKIISYVDEAYFHLGNYNKAINHFRELTRQAGKDKNSHAYNKYLERIGDYQLARGNKEDAYVSYREGHAYEQAMQLGRELGKPDEDITRLDLEQALEQGDFDKAIDLAEKLGDPQQAAALRGQQMKSRGRYGDAIEHFVQAGDLEQVLACVETDAWQADQEQFQTKVKILRTAKNFEGSLCPEHKNRVLDLIEEVREDEGWKDHISPQEMGLVYEKVARFSSTIDFYGAYLEKQWAREGQLRVKEAQQRDLAARKDGRA